MPDSANPLESRWRSLGTEPLSRTASAVKHDSHSIEYRGLSVGGRRSWSLPLTVSTAVHLAAILVCAWWSRTLVPSQPYALSTRLATAIQQPVDVQLDRPLAEAPAIESVSGGAPPPISAPLNRQPLFADFHFASRVEVGLGSEVIPSEAIDLSEVVTVGRRSAQRSQHGLGGGAGDGIGEGSGGGFFGTNVAGRRFVYVVDASRSMNHPHDSEAKTRFKRLKIELLRSIGLMTPEMEFYIVFFNDHAIPMPAYGLQRAVPANQRRFLHWMQSIQADGKTDPRSALQLALRLRPDVIHFLTDGNFQPVIARDLLKIRQHEVSIHTYAFGERDAEETLRAVAENNGGEYHFVP